MGMFPCELCGKPMAVLSEDGLLHEQCDPKDILANIRHLQDTARAANNARDRIQDAVLMILQGLPSLKGETVAIPTAKLRELWDAAECEVRDSRCLDTFLSRWVVMHSILSAAYSLFRGRGIRLSVRDKLQRLLEACHQSQLVMGYQDSPLTVPVEEVLRKAREESR